MRYSLYLFLLVFFLFNFPIKSHAQNYKESSPNNRIVASINAENGVSLSISFDGEKIIELSSIYLKKERVKEAKEKLEIISAISGIFKGEMTPEIPYKDALIPFEYNKVFLSLSNEQVLIIRLYNDGFAYRFVDYNDNSQIVIDEGLRMTFPESTTSYFPKEDFMYSHNERLYLNKGITEIDKGEFCSLPVMFKSGSTHVLFTEASLHSYPGLFLEKDADDLSFKSKFPRYVLKAVPNEEKSPDRNQLITDEADYIAKAPGQGKYPWRVFMISDDERTFVESNLVTLLSGSSKNHDFSWIKPGKVAWDWYNANNIFGVDFESGINTETYKYYIDFASKNSIEYIILDEGWTKSTREIMEDHDEIDVKALIEYGEQKNVGIILWVLWKPLHVNMNEILKLYSDWGAKGIKVDFMQRNDQYMVNSYEQIAEIAAKYQLLVDFHGAFKPAGIERVWPNVLTYEGVKGNENNKWSALITPDHNLTIPFIRMAAGPMDFTPGSMLNCTEKNFSIRWDRPMSLGTRCHQVAMYVVYESPLQMMCESPSIYYKEQETVDFITQIPTTWDETMVFEAAISDYILLARRKGENWYIGAMTDWTQREFELDLSFLGTGKYSMELMKDGSNAHRYAEDYKKENLQVDSSSSIKLDLASGGGWAAIIKKQ